MKKNQVFLGICIAILLSGCASQDEIVPDFCPDNPNKTAPGLCGCDKDETLDENNNGTPDCLETNTGVCPAGSLKTEPGVCGCDTPDTDSDNDGTPDCLDGCKTDPNKKAPGACGCETPDTDTDNDGYPDCIDKCIDDPNKVFPGICGCHEDDTIDTNENLVPDCKENGYDLCPSDPDKTEPGLCGCNIPDTDTDNDGTPDCLDLCPTDPEKIKPGICNCGTPDADTDNDGIYDCFDECPQDPNKVFKGLCGCMTPDSAENIVDSDGDGVINCLDACPNNPIKSAEGSAGGGCEYDDIDGDGVDDKLDACPYNPNVHEKDIDCNYAKDADGNTIFEIWSAYDFKRLSEESMKKAPASKIGFRCDKSEVGGYKCLDAEKSNERVYCANYNTIYTWTANNCAANKVCVVNETLATTNKTECKTTPACHQTDNPSAAGDCCTSGFKSICKDDSILSCDGTKLIETKCPGGCTLPAATEDNPEPEAICTMCTGTTPVTTGGDEFACCDVESYTSSCSADGSLLKCIDGRVTKDKCEVECNNGDAETPAYCASCKGTTPVTTDGDEFACCDAENYTNTCTAAGNIFKCVDGRVTKTECEIGCNAETVSCVPCLGETVTSGGDINQCCNTATYQNSCADDGKLLYCSQGHVEKKDCLGSCQTREIVTNPDNPTTTAMCLDPSENTETTIHARIMQNINISDVVTPEETNFGCAGKWTSLDLYQTHIDGNGKTITFGNQSKRCALTYPLFDNFIESSIKDINLDYDMRGAAPAAFSSHMQKSSVTNVKWLGSWYGGISIFGEKSNYSGIFAETAENTVLDKVSYNGDIQAIIGKFYGLAGILNSSYIVNSTVSPKSYICSANTCATTAYTIYNKTSPSFIKNLTIDIPNLEYYSTVCGCLYSVNNSYLENIDASFTNLTVQNDSNASAYFYGLGNSITNLNHAKINIKDANILYLYGVSSSLYNVNNINITEENIKSTNFYGVANSGYNKLDNINIKQNSINASSYYGAFNSMYGTINDIVLDLTDISSTSNAYLLSNASNSSTTLSNLTYNADKIKSGSNTYLINSINNYNITLSNIDLRIKTLLSSSAVSMFNTVSTTTNIFTLSNSSFLIDYLQGTSSRFIYSLGTSNIEDVSYYANNYVSSTTNNGFIYQSNNASANINLNRVVVSSNYHTFTTIDSDGKATNGVVNYTIPAMYGNTGATYSSFNTTETYWYRRTDSQKASNFADLETKFAPFTKDVISDFTSYMDGKTDKTWEIREVTEDGQTIKIPMVKPQTPVIE